MCKVIVLENRNGRSCSTSRLNYDQSCSVSLPNYDQSCSISLPSYDQSCSISLPNYDQGVQHYQFEGFFLLTEGGNFKIELEEKFVFKSSFIPQKIDSFRFSSPLIEELNETMLFARYFFKKQGLGKLSYERAGQENFFLPTSCW